MLGNAQFTSDSSSSKGLLSNQMLSGTCSDDTHGGAVFTVFRRLDCMNLLCRFTHQNGISLR
jgi:hypothetical protein